MRAKYANARDCIESVYRALIENLLWEVRKDYEPFLKVRSITI